jgi:hypothetical protein
MQKMSPVSIPMWVNGMLPGFFESKTPASGNSNPNNGKQKNILNIINFSIIINI